MVLRWFIVAVTLGLLAVPPPARAARRHFSSPFACSAGRAAVDGSIALGLTPAFKLRGSFDGIDAVKAAVTARADVDLKVRVGPGASCSLSRTVARWNAPPLRFSLGPVPLVIVPRVAVRVEGQASADAAVTAGIRGHFDATAGVRWDGTSHPIGRFRHSLSYTAPAAHASAAVGARVIPSITFLLYGRAGPRFDLSTGLQLDADASADPWWTLSAPVELSAALELPGVDNVSIPRLTVFTRTFPIAHADPTPPAAVPQSQQQAEPSPVAERARISWDTAATDVDLHVWDEAGNHAWFRDPAGIPSGGLSEDDRFGFGPEHFADGGGGRSLTFGLCYFDESGAGATHVSVRLTDPDGTVHDSTRTLAREGDHVLLGSSPAGNGYVPPDGWCRP